MSDVKKGFFLGVLAGKQGLGDQQKTLYFAFFHVLMDFFVCKLLSGKIFQQMEVSKKNRAKKPTVGFLFSAGSGNIAS